ncbi:MAG TPA: tetratricopeptide repeat protein [Acidobacteriota bacterium]|nr:tetratricopeptide repeat protein [Acidobacteriota bacterium]
MEEEEKSRLEQFKEFVELDPSDTFSRYALALEYMGVAQFDDAVSHLREVVKQDPTYSAAYFQAAIASRKNGSNDQAIEFLNRGIEAAEKKGDWHARDEMKAVLEEIQSES